MTHLRSIVFVAIIASLWISLNTGDAKAQLASVASHSGGVSAVTGGGIGGSGGSPTGGSSGGGGSWGSSHYGPRAAISFYWNDQQPTVIQNRTVSPTPIPPARRGTSANLITPILPAAHNGSGLSTAMPGWKLAAAVTQNQAPTTGHSTYAPPATVNSTSVVIPRRRYSFGVTVFRY